MNYFVLGSILLFKRTFFTFNGKFFYFFFPTLSYLPVKGYMGQEMNIELAIDKRNT